MLTGKAPYLSLEWMETEVMQHPPVDVSVIIPCHNYAQFLPDSVGSALSQVGVNVEVIVVNDGSTDNFDQVITALSDPRLRVINQPQSGIAAARNAGSSVSVGSLLAFLDADDRWRENRLARAKSTIESTPQPLLCFAMLEEFLDSGLDLDHAPVPHVRTVRGISASSCVITREVFERVGRFDPKLESGEFIDWYLRAQSLGIEDFIDPEVLVYRRVHTFNRDRQGRDSSKEYARILMRKIRSQRGGDTNNYSGK